MVPADGFVDGMLKSINSHLPSKRVPISELNLQDDPSYISRDGTVYYIDILEIESIVSLLDSDEEGMLRLPIPVMTDTTGSVGRWVVRGKLEARVISDALSKQLESDGTLILYFPHMRELRRRFPTAVTVMFVP